MLVALVLFLAILGILAYLDTKKPKKYPPGPKWLPILGSALTVLNYRKKFGHMFEATAELAKKYGPIIGLKIGRDLVVMVYGTQEIREFLTSEDLAGRPQGNFFEMRTWGKRRGLLLTDSELWQEQRRFALRQLREFGFGRRNMSTMIEQEANFMVEDLKTKINATKSKSITLNLENVFNIHILNTLWMMMAGIRYSPEDKDLKNLQGILAHLFASIDMFGAPFSQFPFLKYVAPDSSGYSLYMQTHMRIWEFLGNEIKRHKETHDPNEPRDFMDVYLNILNSAKKHHTFTEEQLLAICMDMFMAGSETTSKSLGFAFLYLILYPEVQKKAQEEIDRVIGRERSPTLEDRPNMPYVECVVLETLRVFSGRAFTIPHRATRDTYLNGYFIPKDVMVIASLHGSLMGEKSVFENPEIFRPERYMKDGKISVGESHVPFGIGKHRCMGETLARANVFLFTSTLLQHFSFSAPEECPPSLKCFDGVTPGPKNVKTICTPRF